MGLRVRVQGLRFVEFIQGSRPGKVARSSLDVHATGAGFRVLGLGIWEMQWARE